MLHFRNKQKFLLKIWYKNFETGKHDVLTFQICILWTEWERALEGLLKSVTALSGGACSEQTGSGRFIAGIDYMIKMKYFLSNKKYGKNNIFRNIPLFWFCIWLWEEALGYEFALFRSATLAII